MSTSQSLLLIVLIGSAIGGREAVAATDETTNPTAVPPAAVVVDSWETIKDYPYEQRLEFVATLNRMAEKIDTSTAELDPKRDRLTEASAKEWDFAMKELEAARADLRSKITDLNKVRADAWNEAKERVATAWARTQAAFDSLKRSTTS